MRYVIVALAGSPGGETELPEDVTHELVLPADPRLAVIAEFTEQLRKKVEGLQPADSPPRDDSVWEQGWDAGHGQCKADVLGLLPAPGGDERASGVRAVSERLMAEEQGVFDRLAATDAPASVPADADLRDRIRRLPEGLDLHGPHGDDREFLRGYETAVKAALDELDLASVPVPESDKAAILKDLADRVREELETDLRRRIEVVRAQAESGESPDEMWRTGYVEALSDVLSWDWSPASEPELLRCCKCRNTVAGSPRFCPYCRFAVFEIAPSPVPEEPEGVWISQRSFEAIKYALGRGIHEARGGEDMREALLEIENQLPFEESPAPVPVEEPGERKCERCGGTGEIVTQLPPGGLMECWGKEGPRYDTPYAEIPCPDCSAPSPVPEEPEGENYRKTARRLAMEKVDRDELLAEFDAWLSFRPEFSEVLTAFREAFGTDTSADGAPVPVEEPEPKLHQNIATGQWFREDGEREVQEGDWFLTKSSKPTPESYDPVMKGAVRTILKPVDPPAPAPEIKPQQIVEDPSPPTDEDIEDSRRFYEGVRERGAAPEIKVGQRVKVRATGAAGTVDELDDSRIRVRWDLTNDTHWYDDLSHLLSVAKLFPAPSLNPEGLAWLDREIERVRADMDETSRQKDYGLSVRLGDRLGALLDVRSRLVSTPSEADSE